MNGKCSEPVEQVKIWPGMSAGALVLALGKSGAYNGGALARGAALYEKMLRDEEAVKFFGLAGAMVPAGMGGIVSDLIGRGHIDVLVTTGANLTHDIIEAIGCRHYHGSAFCSDVDLREDGINRIYDVYLPNEAFIKFEEEMQRIFSELREGSTLTLRELLAHIGGRMKSGILATAAREGIPVYCPALADSMIGLQYWLFSQTRPRDRRRLFRHEAAHRPLFQGRTGRGAPRRRGGSQELHPPEHADDTPRFRLRGPAHR